MGQQKYGYRCPAPRQQMDMNGELSALGFLTKEIIPETGCTEFRIASEKFLDFCRREGL
jgi:hypothetical protein